jgi:hypothetical protein
MTCKGMQFKIQERGYKWKVEEWKGLKLKTKKEPKTEERDYRKKTDKQKKIRRNEEWNKATMNTEKLKIKNSRTVHAEQRIINGKLK